MQPEGRDKQRGGSKGTKKGVESRLVPGGHCVLTAGNCYRQTTALPHTCTPQIPALCVITVPPFHPSEGLDGYELCYNKISFRKTKPVVFPVATVSQDSEKGRRSLNTGSLSWKCNWFILLSLLYSNPGIFWSCPPPLVF